MSRYRRLESGSITPPHQLAVDHVVHRGAVGLVGHDHLESVALEPATVEVVLHRVARAEQCDPLHARRPNSAGRGVGEVQELDLDRRLDPVGQQMHRVGAQHDDLCTGVLQQHRVGGEQVAGGIPVSRRLECLDPGEVVAADDQVGRVDDRRAGRGHPR